jgi:integrase
LTAFAWDDEILVDRPVFPVVRATNVRTGFVDDETITKILAALPPYMSALAEFCYRTAWRRGEAAGHLWSDLDFGAGEIRLPDSRTKSGEPATFPFSADERLAALLGEQKGRAEAWGRERGELVPHVFWRGTRNGALPVGDCRKSWETAVKAAGVPALLLPICAAAARAFGPSAAFRIVWAWRSATGRRAASTTGIAS